MTEVLFIILGFMAGAFVAGAFFVKEVKKNSLLEKENAGLKAEIKAKEEVQIKESELFTLIKKEFSSTANEVLIEKQKTLQEQNKTSLESFLKPLAEKIKEFQFKVEAADKEGAKNTATIKEKIEELVKQTQMTSLQTEKLSEAISQNSKTRGLLGEFVLSKILESSGLVKGSEYLAGNFSTQLGFKAAEDDSRRITDAIIYLPGSSKSVVIDSKANLPEFIEFVQSKDEKEKEAHLKAFMADVSASVKELGNKYTNLKEVNTLDFTIMFIPFEPPMSYIYSNNKLIEEALKQNVIIAGPSTLIATLRTINYSWSQKKQYDNIKDITKLGSSIYDKACIFLKKIEEVRTSFNTVTGKFDDLFKTSQGKGGLLGQIEKLKEYGISSSKEIDPKYLEEKAEDELARLEG